jgi:glucose-6-phosphate 1-dehydrogenase
METLKMADLASNADEQCLAIIIVGASGDLAKKKTYPSLLSLYAGNLLPPELVVYGYARSLSTDEQLRDQIRPYLAAKHVADSVVEEFLSLCFYKSGKGYGDVESWEELDAILKNKQEGQQNRLFYFAIPPNVFAETGAAIRAACMASNGFSRMIVEKPFGRDLESCKDILESLGRHFDESNLYRIDHYLGKEMVQNLIVMRFGNIWMENMWNRNYVQCIVLTFKEPFGTQGRGGYFDQYGIIRDVIQNHLLQGESTCA